VTHYLTLDEEKIWRRRGILSALSTMIRTRSGVRGPDEFEGAFAAMAAGRAEALTVLEDSMIATNARRVADFAIKQRLPTVGFKE